MAAADDAARTALPTRIATVHDRHAVVATLIDAFSEDPVLSWVFPDRAKRMRYGVGFFDQLARRVLRNGLSQVADGGAAVWAGPGNWRESAGGMLQLARTLPGIPHPLRVMRGLSGIEARHPREPHLYLAAVGVRADRRGQGLASRLMAPTLASADAQSLPCYLESSNPLNVPLYERHGFAVTEERRLPQGPPMWLMWRPANAAATTS